MACAPIPRSAAIIAETRDVASRAAGEGTEVVLISARIEAKVAELAADERLAFLESLGLHDTGLNRVIGAGYRLLDLITFFTAAPKEARA